MLDSDGCRRDFGKTRGARCRVRVIDVSVGNRGTFRWSVCQPSGGAVGIGRGIGRIL